MRARPSRRRIYLQGVPREFSVHVRPMDSRVFYAEIDATDESRRRPRIVKRVGSEVEGEGGNPRLFAGTIVHQIAVFADGDKWRCRIKRSREK